MIFYIIRRDSDLCFYNKVEDLFCYNDATIYDDLQILLNDFMSLSRFHYVHILKCQTEIMDTNFIKVKQHDIK